MLHHYLIFLTSPFCCSHFCDLDWISKHLVTACVRYSQRWASLPGLPISSFWSLYQNISKTGGGERGYRAIYRSHQVPINHYNLLVNERWLDTHTVGVWSWCLWWSALLETVPPPGSALETPSHPGTWITAEYVRCHAQYHIAVSCDWLHVTIIMHVNIFWGSDEDHVDVVHWSLCI